MLSEQGEYHFAKLTQGRGVKGGNSYVCLHTQSDCHFIFFFIISSTWKHFTINIYYVLKLEKLFCKVFHNKVLDKISLPVCRHPCWIIGPFWSLKVEIRTKPLMLDNIMHTEDVSQRPIETWHPNQLRQHIRKHFLKSAMQVNIRYI